tara:strand:- start:296 stop:577 length:282 start_codon:yes stop_codon:yes gene_type:complete
MTVCKGILFSQIRVCKNSSGPLPAVIFFGKKQNNSADPHPLLMPVLTGGSLLFAEKNRQREGDTSRALAMQNPRIALARWEKKNLGLKKPLSA